MSKQAALPARAPGDAPHNHIVFVEPRKTVNASAHRPSDKEDGTRATLDQLCQLPYLEEDEDYVRPTLYAFEAALNLLLSARDILYQNSAPFPHATFGTTDKGSLLIYWRKPGRSVQAVVPCQPKGDGYVHVLEGSTPTIHDDLDGVTLARALAESTA